MSKLVITVSEPWKQGEGMNTFISYKVTTSTDRLPHFAASDFSVIRRFSDFSWLHTQLVTEFPGVFLPPIPDKAIMNRFTPEFIEDRRRALERYLGKVAEHPDLTNSRFLKVFLEADEGFAAVKTESTKGKGGLISWFSSAASSVVSTTPKVKSEEDLKFEEVRKYVNALNVKLEGVARHTGTMLQKQTELSTSQQDFGLSFALLGQCEEGVLGKALDQLGKTADIIAHVTSDAGKEDAEKFEESIKEYGRYLLCVEEAFKVREEKVGLYHGAAGALASAKANHEKLTVTPGTKEAKLTAAQQEVTKAEGHLEECTSELKSVNDRMGREVERFKAQKLLDFKKLCSDYVRRQLDYCVKMENAWKELLPQIENIEYTSSAVGPPASIGSVYPPLPEKGEGGNPFDT